MGRFYPCLIFHPLSHLSEVGICPAQRHLVWPKWFNQNKGFLFFMWWKVQRSGSPSLLQLLRASLGTQDPAPPSPEWVASIVISTRWLHPQQNLCPRQEGKKKGREGKACVSWVCRYLWGKQWISPKPPQQASGHLSLAGTGYKITTGCKGAWEGEHFIWDIVSQTRLGFCWWRRGESRSRVGSSVCLRTIFPVLWTRGFKTYSKPCTWSVKKPDSASKIPICVWAGVRCWALFLLHHDTNNGNTYGRSDWFVCLCIHLFTPGVCMWCVRAHMHMHSFLPEMWIEFVLHQCFYWGKKKDLIQLFA